MFTEELCEFIEKQTERVKKYYNCHDPKMFAFQAVAKLAEEFGELSREVLAYHGVRHKDKIDQHSKETLAKEIADVLITTLILSRFFDIDIQKVMKEKIEEITKRYS